MKKKWTSLLLALGLAVFAGMLFSACGDNTPPVIGGQEGEHEHAFSSQVQSPATCTDPGVVFYKCKGCDYFTMGILPALGHDCVEKVEKQSTCTTDAVIKYSCKNCSYTYTETRPTEGHNYQGKVEKPSTCVTSGVEVFTCSVCKISYREAIDPLGHDEDVTVIQQATCTQTGQASIRCKRSGCNESRVDVLPLIPHTEKIVQGATATCTLGGKSNTVVCEVCNTVIQDGDPIAPLGHDCDEKTGKCVRESCNYEMTVGLSLKKEGNNYTVVGYTGSATSVIIPDTSAKDLLPITAIANNAFSGNKQITSIKFSSNLLSIGDNAFYDCNGLNSVELPSSLVSLGEGTFWNCTSLKTIALSEKLQSVKSTSFLNCSSLEAFSVPEQNTTFQTISGALYSKDGKTLYQYPAKSVEKMVILPDLTSIDAYAFYKCTNIQSIVLPSSLQSIGYQAFWRCDSLSLVKFAQKGEWQTVFTNNLAPVVVTVGENGAEGTDAENLTSEFVLATWTKK